MWPQRDSYQCACVPKNPGFSLVRRVSEDRRQQQAILTALLQLAGVVDMVGDGDRHARA